MPYCWPKILADHDPTDTQLMCMNNISLLLFSIYSFISAEFQCPFSNLQAAMLTVQDNVFHYQSTILIFMVLYLVSHIHHSPSFNSPCMHALILVIQPEVSYLNTERIWPLFKLQKTFIPLQNSMLRQLN